MREAHARAVITLLLFTALLCPILFVSTCLAQTEAPGTFDLDKDRQSLVSLDGPWRRQVGDDPHWADPKFDDSGWPIIRPTQAWSEQKFSGTAWYRATVHVPANAGPLALYLYYIDDSYQIFVDGKILLSAGGLPPNPKSYGIAPRVVLLPDHPNDAAYSFTLAIRVWLSPTWAEFHPGGVSPGSKIGSPTLAYNAFETQTTRWAWGQVSNTLLATLEGVAACAALALFAFRREEREYLWFGLLLISSVANRCYLNYYQFHTLGNTQVGLALSLLNAAAAFAQVAFYYRLLGARRNWALWVVLSAAFCNLLLVLPASLDLIDQAFISICVILLFLPTILWIFALLIRRAIQGFEDARLLIAPVFFSKITTLIAIAIWLSMSTSLYRGPSDWFNRTLSWPFSISLADIGDALFLIGMLAVLIHRFTRTRLHEESYERERAAARTVQQLLIPEIVSDIPGFEIGCVYRPFGEVGGDFFQVIPLDERSTLIAIGDVSGKGLPAALMVSLAVGTLRTYAETLTSPAAILSGLNRRLHERPSGGFTTCLILRADADGTLTLANAGHLSPYVNHHEIPLESSLPLGILPEATYNETVRHLATGESVTLLTDGVLEARNHAGELFGFERTQAVSDKSAPEIALAAKTFGQDDDITVLQLIRRAV